MCKFLGVYQRGDSVGPCVGARVCACVRLHVHAKDVAEPGECTEESLRGVPKADDKGGEAGRRTDWPPQLAKGKDNGG